MSEQATHTPDELTSNSDIAEVKRVLYWMDRIDDAYEPGSAFEISELIMAMKAECDADVIAAVQEARRLDERSRLTGQVQ
jgi:hypothetical protein